MKDKDTILLEQAYQSIFENEMGYPANWNKGFQHPIRIASGGQEVPFIKDGRWYLYVWDSQKQKHYIYSYTDDRFYDDDYFSDIPKINKDEVDDFKSVAKESVELNENLVRGLGKLALGAAMAASPMLSKASPPENPNYPVVAQQVNTMQDNLKTANLISNISKQAEDVALKPKNSEIGQTISLDRLRDQLKKAFNVQTDDELNNKIDEFLNKYKDSDYKILFNGLKFLKAKAPTVTI
jgi:hypothetical protein